MHQVRPNELKKNQPELKLIPKVQNKLSTEPNS